MTSGLSSFLVVATDSCEAGNNDAYGDFGGGGDWWRSEDEQ